MEGQDWVKITKQQQETHWLAAHQELKRTPRQKQILAAREDKTRWFKIPTTKVPLYLFVFLSRPPCSSPPAFGLCGFLWLSLGGSLLSCQAKAQPLLWGHGNAGFHVLMLSLHSNGLDFTPLVIIVYWYLDSICKASSSCLVIVLSGPFKGFSSSCSFITAYLSISPSGSNFFLGMAKGIFFLFPSFNTRLFFCAVMEIKGSWAEALAQQLLLQKQDGCQWWTSVTFGDGGGGGTGWATSY